MLTLKEAAAELKLSEEATRILIKSGDLRAGKAGNGLTSPWRIPESAITDYLNGQIAKAAS